MSKKYKITSTSSLLPLSVKFKEENGDEEQTINVKIDYRNDRVYFEDTESNTVDLESLEKEILEIFKPPEVEIPDFYHEHMAKVREVSQSNFASSFLDSYQRNGGNNDSRES